MFPFVDKFKIWMNSAAVGKFSLAEVWHTGVVYFPDFAGVVICSANRSRLKNRSAPPPFTRLNKSVINAFHRQDIIRGYSRFRDISSHDIGFTRALLGSSVIADAYNNFLRRLHLELQVAHRRVIRACGA